MREQLTGDRHRIAVDIDGTITDGHSRWWDGNWGEPHDEAIEWVNQQYIDGHTIMLYTARPEKVRPGTKAWLDRHGVRYHTLVMDKLSADLYIDNRSAPALLIQSESAPDVGEVGDEITAAFGDDNELPAPALSNVVSALADAMEENTSNRGDNAE